MVSVRPRAGLPLRSGRGTSAMRRDCWCASCRSPWGSRLRRRSTCGWCRR